MNDEVLVDTDVFSYLLKRDTRAAPFALLLSNRRSVLAFATLGELHRWALRLNFGSTRLDEMREQTAKCRVIWPDDAVTQEWARVVSVTGHPVDANDGWIAACAIRHGLPLLTHNRRHFEHVPGLTLL